jgi:hypothetical protein
VSRGLASLIAVAALALASAVLTPGCGGSDEKLLSEQGLRECLGSSQVGGPPPQGVDVSSFAPVYLDTAPDFTVYARGGSPVYAVVQRSEAKARVSAAHVRSALVSLGEQRGEANARVVSGRNAVIVFARTPSASERSSARSCLQTS